MKIIRISLPRLSLIAICAVVYLSRFAAAQACICTPPISNQQWWAPHTQISVYIDPIFASNSEAGSIQTAISDWFQQAALMSNSVTYTLVTTDPGTSARDVIRILDTPNSGQMRLAVTTPWLVTTASGVVMQQMANATVTFDRTFMLNASTPAYNPTDPSAPQFLIKVFHHELGHVFGEQDAVAPIDFTLSPPMASTCVQSPAATVMNGTCGTNDNPSGVMPIAITSCDNSVANVTIAVGGTARTNLAAEYVLRQGCTLAVYDSSVWGLNGTLAGGTWTSQGLQLSDSNTADGVVLPDSVLVSAGIPITGFAIEFWVNVDPESYGDYFASFSNSGISLFQYAWSGQTYADAWING